MAKRTRKPQKPMLNLEFWNTYPGRAGEGNITYCRAPKQTYYRFRPKLIKAERLG